MSTRAQYDAYVASWRRAVPKPIGKERPLTFAEWSEPARGDSVRAPAKRNAAPKKPIALSAAQRAEVRRRARELARKQRPAAVRDCCDDEFYEKQAAFLRANGVRFGDEAGMPVTHVTIASTHGSLKVPTSVAHLLDEAKLANVPHRGGTQLVDWIAPDGERVRLEENMANAIEDYLAELNAIGKDASIEDRSGYRLLKRLGRL